VEVNGQELGIICRYPLHNMHQKKLSHEIYLNSKIVTAHE